MCHVLLLRRNDQRCHYKNETRDGFVPCCWQIRAFLLVIPCLLSFIHIYSPVFCYSSILFVPLNLYIVHIPSVILLSTHNVENLAPLVSVSVVSGGSSITQGKLDRLCESTKPLLSFVIVRAASISSDQYEWKD